MIKTVGQVLHNKGRDVWSIGPDALVFEALALMAEKDIGALLVVENEKPIGMISEREYARKVVLKGHLATDTKVGDIMREQVEYARPNQTVQECMAMVTELRHRHLPVLENDKVVGVVSIGDLVKAVIDHQQFVIEQLEDYIVR